MMGIGWVMVRRRSTDITHASFSWVDEITMRFIVVVSRGWGITIVVSIVVRSVRMPVLMGFGSITFIKREVEVRSHAAGKKNE